MFNEYSFLEEDEDFDREACIKALVEDFSEDEEDLEDLDDYELESMLREYLDEQDDTSAMLPNDEDDWFEDHAWD